MKKTYLDKLDYDKTFKDSNNNKWKYYSNKAIKKLYPKDGEKSFKIVGELIKKQGDFDLFIENNGEKLGIGRIGYHNKVLNSVSGYMQCGEDEFILVMKKNFAPVFMTFMVALIIIPLTLWSKSPEGPNLDENASDYIAKLEKPENFDPSRIAIPGYGEIVVKEGDTHAYVALANPEYNSAYFQFDVALDQTGESLLKTDLIAPGKAITAIPLSENMKPGTYDITININTYSLENHKNKLNGANVKTKLIILET